jgi:hypothetical protein
MARNNGTGRDESRGDPGAFVANWRESDLPFLEKLAVAGRNTFRKAATLKRCCGHPGEPGC